MRRRALPAVEIGGSSTGGADERRMNVGSPRRFPQYPQAPVYARSGGFTGSPWAAGGAMGVAAEGNNGANEEGLREGGYSPRLTGAEQNCILRHPLCAANGRDSAGSYAELSLTGVESVDDWDRGRPLTDDKN